MLYWSGIQKPFSFLSRTSIPQMQKYRRAVPLAKVILHSWSAVPHLVGGMRTLVATGARGLGLVATGTPGRRSTGSVHLREWSPRISATSCGVRRRRARQSIGAEFFVAEGTLAGTVSKSLSTSIGTSSAIFVMESCCELEGWPRSVTCELP